MGAFQKTLVPICAAAVMLALLAGCTNATAGSPAGQSPTGSASQVTAPASSSAAHAAPTLGIAWGPYQEGYGLVAPTQVNNGGDPTGVVSQVHWQSWGGATATGHGMSDDDNNSPTVAAGPQETATIVAFNLGVCQGQYMYQAVEWYFPQDGETFTPDSYRNTCTGDYVN